MIPGIVAGGASAAAPASTYSYFNPSDKAASSVLSDSNKVVGGSATGKKWARSVVAKNSGKWRIEFVIDAHVDDCGCGFAKSGALGTYAGGNSLAWMLFGNYVSMLRMYHNNAPVSYPGTQSTGTVYCLLLDIDNGKAWWRKDGTVVSGDPVAGTGAMATFTAGSTIYLAADPYASASAIRLRANPADFTRSPVSGFTDGWPD